MAIKQTVAPRKKLPFTAEVRQRWRKVRKAILAQPELYEQGVWGPTGSDVVCGLAHTCGSAMCLAGWYCHFLPEKDALKLQPWAVIRRDHQWDDDLAITDGAGEAWPAGMYDALTKAKTEKQKAKVAAKRIDHLLRTGE